MKTMLAAVLHDFNDLRLEEVPAPRAPLYVWLQGEERGRLTESRF